jgi:hypothetical protein
MRVTNETNGRVETVFEPGDIVEVIGIGADCMYILATPLYIHKNEEKLKLENKLVLHALNGKSSYDHGVTQSQLKMKVEAGSIVHYPKGKYKLVLKDA